MGYGWILESCVELLRCCWKAFEREAVSKLGWNVFSRSLDSSTCLHSGGIV